MRISTASLLSDNLQTFTARNLMRTSTLGINLTRKQNILSLTGLGVTLKTKSEHSAAGLFKIYRYIQSIMLS